jgi:hypothetical protein
MDNLGEGAEGGNEGPKRRILETYQYESDTPRALPYIESVDRVGVSGGV